jgi:hypothetical protein
VQVMITYLCWKAWRKEEKNWTVKYNLCYWMSNTCIITDFYFTKYNTFPNLPIIKESQMQIEIYKHICADMHWFLPQVLYTVWCLSKLYTDKNVCKNNLCFQRKKVRKKIKKTAQIGTNVRARVFNARLLARNQFASRRFCDWPTSSSWYPNSTLHCMLHMQPSQW